MVLLHKSLDYVLKEVQRDDEGRLLLLRLKMHSKELRIANVYASTRGYLIKLSSWLANAQHKFHIVGGYFNSVMDEVEDKRTAGNKRKVMGHRGGGDCENLASTMDALRLQDLWRVVHPIDAEFTHTVGIESLSTPGKNFY